MELVLNHGVLDFEFAKAVREKTLYVPLTPENIKKFCLPCEFMKMNGEKKNGISIWKYTRLHLVDQDTNEYLDFQVKSITMGKKPPIDDMVFFIVKFD